VNLRKILDDHAAWLRGTGGARANLSDADLHGADLHGADLHGADLRGVSTHDYLHLPDGCDCRRFDDGRRWP